VTKQILSDGTIVWLKGNSRLAFPAKFGDNKREVTLEGEALFEVAKDEEHPFRIYCGTLTTTVLGTSFNIRDTGEEIAVSVLTGKVSVASQKTEQRIIYSNESIVYSETHATVEHAHPTETAIHEFTRGTEYAMAFNDASMIEVIQRIEKKFEVGINLKDTAILKSLITADMTDQSLENTMEIIGQALNLDVEIRGRIVSLQPKK
jgi:ferric-dicitrate binding protein FerR (iron transport regulator)